MGRPPRDARTLDDATLDAQSDTRRGDGARPGLWVIFSPLPQVEGATVRLPREGLALNRWTELDGGGQLEYPRISQVHAEIRARAPDSFEVVDLGSHNGTLVNGVAVVRPTPLAPGDLIEVGGTFLQLVDDVAECAAAEADDGVRRELVGTSPQLRKLRTRIRQLGQAKISVLVLGPSGAGKERTARALHAASGRDGALVSLNCAVLTSEFAASELFGHLKGAFTGAMGSRPGAFREAAGGTLFLDELGEMPLPLQAKLLRALQERRVRPLGSDRDVEVDVRVVAATNRDLPAEVDEDRFRGDLFSRIAAAVLELPPLRERPADIIALAHYFLDGRRLHRKTAGALLSYDWPYNVRDLRTVVALLESDQSSDGPVRLNEAVCDKLGIGARVEARAVAKAAPPDAPAAAAEAPAVGKITPSEAPAEPLIPWPDDEGERVVLLKRLLVEHQGNVSQIGRMLGKAARSMRRWIKLYGIDADRYR